MDFLRRLLAAAYDEPLGRLADLRRAGLRIYSSPDYALLPSWDEEPLPSWTAAVSLAAGAIAARRPLPVDVLSLRPPAGHRPPVPTWPATCTCCRFPAACCFSGAHAAI